MTTWEEALAVAENFDESEAEPSETTETPVEPEREDLLTPEEIDFLDTLIQRQIAQLLCDLSELLLKPGFINRTGIAVMHRAVTERRTYSEYETTLWRLRGHYGTDPFNANDAFRVVKLSRLRLKQHLQHAEGDGRADCVDETDARKMWKLR